MLYSILFGFLLTGLTVFIHAVGTSSWIYRLHQIGRAEQGKQENVKFFARFRSLTMTACVLLFLHILEICIWAVAYLLLKDEPNINSFEDGVYFSAVTFTSLGYGDVVLESNWRLLAAIQAVTGLLVFSWSGATLFAVVQRIWKLMRVSDEFHSGPPL